MAAVLACGDGAVLSGLAAAYFYGLIKRRSPPQPEVTAPTVRRVVGIITHRARNLDRRDTALHRLVPITTVPRTLVDLAATLSSDDLALAAHEAEVKYRVNAKKLYAALAWRPRPRAPGSSTGSSTASGSSSASSSACSSSSCDPPGCRCR